MRYILIHLSWVASLLFFFSQKSIFTNSSKDIWNLILLKGIHILNVYTTTFSVYDLHLYKLFNIFSYLMSTASNGDFFIIYIHTSITHPLHSTIFPEYIFLSQLYHLNCNKEKCMCDLGWGDKQLFLIQTSAICRKLLLFETKFMRTHRHLKSCKHLFYL